MKIVKVYSGELGNLFVERICDVDSFVKSVRDSNAFVGESKYPSSDFNDEELISRFEHGVEFVTFPAVKEDDVFAMFGYEDSDKSMYVQISEISTFRV